MESEGVRLRKLSEQQARDAKVREIRARRAEMFLSAMLANLDPDTLELLPEAAVDLADLLAKELGEVK